MPGGECGTQEERSLPHEPARWESNLKRVRLTDPGGSCGLPFPSLVKASVERTLFTPECRFGCALHESTLEACLTGTVLL